MVTAHEFLNSVPKSWTHWIHDLTFEIVKLDVEVVGGKNLQGVALNQGQTNPTLNKSGVILTAGPHNAYTDGMVVSAALRQTLPSEAESRLHFLIKSEHFEKNPILTFLLWLFVNTHLIATKGEMTGLKKAVDMLRQGKYIGIWPEGTREIHDQNKPIEDRNFQEFAAFMLLTRTNNAPLIPVVTQGAEHFWPKGQRWPNLSQILSSTVLVMFGEPIFKEEVAHLDPDREQNRLETIKLVQQRMSAMQKYLRS